jgi:hypothetical protein
MVEAEFLSAQYPRANMVAHVAREPWVSLATTAECRRRTHATGQAESTQDAKRLDLSCFLHFRTRLRLHDDAREWGTLVTERFLKELTRGNISRLSSTGAPHVRLRPPAAPSRVTRLAQSAPEIPESLFLTRTGSALNRKEAFAIFQRMARQANAHPRRRSTYMHPLACFGICGLAKSSTRKECTTRPRSPATAATATSGATSSLMPKARRTPSTSLTKRQRTAAEDFLLGADDACMDAPEYGHPPNEAVLAAFLT